VAGKGGVGKTTVACTLAIASASESTATLLVSTDPAPSIADALAFDVPDEETPIPGVPGLVARQMDAPAAFDRLRQSYQSRIDAVFDAFVARGVDAAHDRAILRDLLALAPPGVDELYALASLGETLAEERFARVIVDPAPTGHLLRLLEMPLLALDWSHRLMRLMLKYREVTGLDDAAEELLAFAKRTRAIDQLLHDPARAGVLIVAIDEPLVRGESVRLQHAVQGQGIDIVGVIWNRAANEPWTPLPGILPDSQYSAPARTPAPIGVDAIRTWGAMWRAGPLVPAA
jgi:arsenite-transporting ATPase